MCLLIFSDDVIEAAWAASLGVHALIWVGHYLVYYTLG
jgi:hypothetical protein